MVERRKGEKVKGEKDGRPFDRLRAGKERIERK